MKTLGQITYEAFDSVGIEAFGTDEQWEAAAQAVRAAVIERCIEVILAEKVDAEETQSDQDEAYNTALMHAAEAIRALKDKK